MTEKAAKASSHWPFLDFLRATAAFLVLLDHSRDSYFPDIGVANQEGVFLKLFYFIANRGHEAVVIFFVRYLIARFSRIFIVCFPALVLTEGVFLFGSLLLGDHGGPIVEYQQLDFGGVSQAICSLSGLQGFSCAPWGQNPPLWSLGYEWALYLFAPAIIQLAVWKASPGLRLLPAALVCAIALTVSRHPGEAVFWFSAWFLGTVSYRVLCAGLVPLPVGLVGAGLMIPGMVVQHLRGSYDLMTDTTVAAGASIFQCIGFPARDALPGPLAFMELGITISVCLLAAYFISLVTERKTGQVRAAMLRMCPPRPDRRVSYSGQRL